MRNAAPVRWLRENYLIVGILGLALGMRLWSLDFGLPYAYHVDEPRYLHAAVGMWRDGTLNPGWFYQPSLFTYLVALVVGGYYGLGLAFGWFSSPADLFQPPYDFDGLTTQPGQFLLARLLTVFLAVLTIATVYAVSRRWIGKIGALAAAAFLTLSIFHVTSSHFVATDAPVGLFIILALYFCSRVLETGQTRDYVLVGLFTGLAVGTKYSAYVLVVPAALAHLVAWRRGRTHLFNPALLLMGGVALATFLATTPYALLDRQDFLADLEYEWTHHKVRGHVGAEGNSGLWLLEQLLFRSDRWLTLFAALGFGAALWRRNWPVILTLSFVVAYFASMATNLVRFERFLVPMIPAMAIGAGYAFAVLTGWLRARLPARTQAIVLAGTVVLLLIEPLISVVNFNTLLGQTDVRTTARSWILENVPADAVIARERFSPNLTAVAYDARWVDPLNQHSAQWYREQGFDYLLFAEARYGNVWRDPERYADLVAAYESLWADLDLVASFEGPYVGRPAHHILVYRVPAAGQ